MSYNHGRGGYRQDSRQSYGRSNMGQHSNQRGSLNVSPWECGVAPNAALSRAGLQSLLPSPPQLQTNSNILSQQQHALVMASNLLSNLGLLPQQQGQQHRSHQDLPSLMNVRTLGNSQQYRMPPQNYNTHGSSRYGNLPPMRRNKPLESHRVEPYKNHRGRAAASQAQQPGRRFPPGKPAGNKPAVAANANSVKSKKPAKAAAAAPPTDAVEGGEVKCEPIEAKSGEDLVAVAGEEDDEAKREPSEEEAKKKRDWKAEKSADDAKMEVDEPSKEGEEVEEVAVEDEAPAEGGAEGKAKTGKFQCHVCNRHVADEQALKHHLALKSHSTKMTRLDASYKARAEEMRAAMKRAVQNARKPAAGSGGRDYCKMCDLNFFGTIVNHRKNEAHLQLKTFLHPRCGTCAREFPTRMEWDLHKLTVAHQVRERKRDDTRQPTSGGVVSARVEGAGGVAKPAHRGKTVMSVDAAYDAQTPVGMEHLATGQHCRLCAKFFERRYDAKLHCMTEEHFNLCLAKAQETAAIESERLKKEEEEKAAAKEAAAEEPPAAVAADEAEIKDEVVDLDNEAGSDEEEGTDEGNWKRRRIADKEDSPNKVPESGAELYNPLEATEEDEVVQIAESPLPEEVQGDILEALDREIGDILETAGDADGNSNGIKEVEEEEEEEKTTPKVVTPGSRGRRGGRGTATRARKRKC